MKSETVSALAIALALALIAGALLAVWLIGPDRLFILAAIFVSGLAAAAIIAASALAIRAYRKNDAPPVVEKHIYHEGRQIIRERVIDGRQPVAPEVKLLQLPAQVQGGAFPELLRAAYQAGALRGAPTETPIEAERIEFDPADWSGDEDADA